MHCPVSLRKSFMAKLLQSSKDLGMFAFHEAGSWRFGGFDLSGSYQCSSRPWPWDMITEA